VVQRGMAKISFYQVAGDTPAQADAVLPKLLEKALLSNQPVALWGATASRMARVDDVLWSYQDRSFLPHALAGGAYDTHQPVLLASADGALEPLPNRLPVILAGAESVLESLLALPEPPPKVVYIFDTRQALTTKAREVWTTLKTQRHELVYWKQDGSGRWVQP
jgi:DNA polymerase III subunit chi